VNVYGFSFKSLLAIETIADFKPLLVGTKVIDNVAKSPGAMVVFAGEEAH
jgi:hypothetical protein